ncbi:MAG: M50 family metallopeptidase [Bacilli bacterium]
MGTILSILLFIICLSTLIVVHELGHLTAAKIFKVYCLDFSIGFGPTLIHKKRKKGETYFSLRAIPLGGFVSMYGEGVELEEGVSIPEERSLNGIKKWKRAIIMCAGIFMNAVLAILLFFNSSMFFPVKNVYIDCLTVQENSIMYNVGITSNDIIRYETLSDEYKENETISLYYFTTSGSAYFSDKDPVNISTGLSTDNLTFKNLDIDNHFRAYVITDTVNGRVYHDVLEEETLIKIVFNINTIRFDEEGNVIRVDDVIQTDPHEITLNVISELDKNDNPVNKFESLGAELYLYSHYNTFSEAISATFKQFGNASTLIIRSVGNLFIGKGWSDVGGPIAIYTQTTSVLSNYGVSYFINLWAIISINLAIINLLPFPGLDGWHLLVIIIEGITRKKVPEKVKNIVATIGMVLLFILMGLIVIKDIVGLF